MKDPYSHIIFQLLYSLHRKFQWTVFVLLELCSALEFSVSNKHRYSSLYSHRYMFVVTSYLNTSSTTTRTVHAFPYKFSISFSAHQLSNFPSDSYYGPATTNQLNRVPKASSCNDWSFKTSLTGMPVPGIQCGRQFFRRGLWRVFWIIFFFLSSNDHISF